MPIAAALAAPAAILLMATAALGQTAPPEQPAAPPAAAQAPLMTAPRPEDQPATEPTASPSGISGSAPSDELQRAAPPVEPGARPLTAAAAQTLIGTEVRTRSGRPWGEIRDFTLTGPEGRIERVVLATAGGTGERLVSVPASTLRLDGAGAERAGATLNLDDADLAKAPPFDYAAGAPTLRGKP